MNVILDDFEEDTYQIAARIDGDSLEAHFKEEAKIF